MAPLLALFLVALAGLPLGKMEGGWREGRIDPCGGWKWGGRQDPADISPSALLFGPGKAVGLGV